MALCGQRLSFTAAATAGWWSQLLIAFIVNSKNWHQRYILVNIYHCRPIEYMNIKIWIYSFTFLWPNMTRTTLLWPCLNAITLTSPHLLLYYVFVVIIRKKDIVCHNVLLLHSFQYWPPNYMISHINVVLSTFDNHHCVIWKYFATHWHQDLGKICC